MKKSRCENCKMQLFDQIPGQDNKVCFPCFVHGLFDDPCGKYEIQMKSMIKTGAIENWINTHPIFKEMLS